MKYYVSSMILCCIIDSILSFLFPLNLGLHMSFVPNYAFIVLMIYVRSIDLKQSIILAILLGIIQDIFLNQTFLLYLAVNILIVFIAYFWSMNISDTKLETIMFSIVCMVIKDFIVYFVMKTTGKTMLSLFNFFIYRESITIVINGLMTVFALIGTQHMFKYMSERDMIQRKGEKILWVSKNS